VTVEVEVEVGVEVMGQDSGRQPEGHMFLITLCMDSRHTILSVMPLLPVRKGAGVMVGNMVVVEDCTMLVTGVCIIFFKTDWNLFLLTCYVEHCLYVLGIWVLGVLSMS
jgi:hypothetical protein